jgi:hypothetical protein
MVMVPGAAARIVPGLDVRATRLFTCVDQGHRELTAHHRHRERNDSSLTASLLPEHCY